MPPPLELDEELLHPQEPTSSVMASSPRADALILAHRPPAHVAPASSRPASDSVLCLPLAPPPPPPIPPVLPRSRNATDRPVPGSPPPHPSLPPSSPHTAVLDPPGSAAYLHTPSLDGARSPARVCLASPARLPSSSALTSSSPCCSRFYLLFFVPSGPGHPRFSRSVTFPGRHVAYRRCRPSRATNRLQRPRKQELFTPSVILLFVK